MVSKQSPGCAPPSRMARSIRRGGGDLARVGVPGLCLESGYIHRGEAAPIDVDNIIDNIDRVALGRATAGHGGRHVSPAPHW